MNRYDYLVKRVEYPAEGGYRMEPFPLPDWIHVEIEHDRGSKDLFVVSRIHVGKRFKVGPQYSDDFTDHEIIKDLSGSICARFDL